MTVLSLNVIPAQLGSSLLIFIVKALPMSALRGLFLYSTCYLVHFGYLLPEHRLWCQQLKVYFCIQLVISPSRRLNSQSGGLLTGMTDLISNWSGLVQNGTIQGILKIFFNFGF